MGGSVWRPLLPVDIRMHIQIQTTQFECTFKDIQIHIRIPVKLRKPSNVQIRIQPYIFNPLPSLDHPTWAQGSKRYIFTKLVEIVISIPKGSMKIM